MLYELYSYVSLSRIGNVRNFAMNAPLPAPWRMTTVIVRDGMRVNCEHNDAEISKWQQIINYKEFQICYEIFVS